jgi:hypothetical protein
MTCLFALCPSPTDGTFVQVQDFGEINQATPSALAAFLLRAFQRYPPSPTRK